MNFTILPTNLPKPKQDGACDHLLNTKIPDISLPTQDGHLLKLNRTDTFRLVIYCYPMTGQPNVTLPDGWDQIPGARGCTPQSCSFRDHYKELQTLGAEVLGLSVQTTEYQKEMVDRLHLPFPVVSDSDYRFQKALSMPTFVASGMTLLKRVTLIVSNGVIQAVHYPIFPSDSDPIWVIDYLKRHQA